VLIHFLLWLHFIGLAMGLGSGIALSQVGPRLVAAPPDQRELLWTFETTFARIGATGLAVLLVTGPALLVLKFGGAEGLGDWFQAKMLFVATLVIGVGLHHWAAARYRKGDDAKAKLMLIGGRIAGASAVLAVLCAAVTFG
jgi:putative membrane protein